MVKDKTAKASADEPIDKDDIVTGGSIGALSDVEEPALADLKDEEEEEDDEDVLNQGQYFDDASDDSVRLYLREIGKNLGDDLAEGKPTLPLLHAMRHGSTPQREGIRRAIEHGGLEELALVMEAVRQTGALEHVRQIARNEAQIGCQAISHLPDSKCRKALVELAAFSVDRHF